MEDARVVGGTEDREIDSTHQWIAGCIHSIVDRYGDLRSLAMPAQGRDRITRRWANPRLTAPPPPSLALAVITAGGGDTCKKVSIF